MTSRLLSLLALTLSSSGVAQIIPMASEDEARLQTLRYDPAQVAQLVAFPQTNLTLMLLPGDRVQRMTLSDRNAFDITVTGSQDSLNILPTRPDAAATLLIETALRRYQFDIRTANDAAAAYVIRLVLNAPSPAPAPLPPAFEMPAPVDTSYRVKGEKALRPTHMSDDGERTYIEWGKYQALPAVFGIGPTGQEEAVNGYMRDGRYTIDRVYPALVFRIDKKQAKARRLTDRSGE